MPLRFSENTVSEEARMEMGITSSENKSSYPLPCPRRGYGQEKGEKVPPGYESGHATSAPITITGKRDDDNRPRLSIDTKHPRHFTPDFRCSSDSSSISSSGSSSDDDDEPSAPSSATEPSPTFHRHSFTSAHYPVKSSHPVTSALRKQPPVEVREKSAAEEEREESDQEQDEDDDEDDDDDDEDRSDEESETGYSGSESDSESDVESEWETDEEEMDDSGVVFEDVTAGSSATILLEDDDDDDDDSDGELEFNLELQSDDEEDDGNEDLDLNIQFGDDDGGVSFSEKVEYFERHTVFKDASPDGEGEDEEEEEDEEANMTCHERFLRMQQEQDEKANNITFSFETSPEDMSMEMELLRAQANSLSTLPDKDFKTVIRNNTENVNNDNDGHIVSAYQTECINSYLEKIWDSFFEIFPRLIDSETYDHFVDRVGTVTSFDEDDRLVLEEGSAEVQRSLSKEISQTLEHWDVRFDQDVIFYVSGKALEPMGRYAAENALFAQLSDNEDEKDNDDDKDDRNEKTVVSCE